MTRANDNIQQTVSSSKLAVERKCLLIVGMHRSGTSALTRVLSLLGADLPQTLMAGTDANKASNATGHWESEAAARLGDMVLDSAGTDWRSPEPVSASWYSSVRYSEMRDRAVELIQEEFANSPLFVFKDPRVCKLLPFWLDVLDRVEVSPRIVSILRSPVEVASSLQARNGFDISLGQLLWLRYVLDGEAASRVTPRVFVTYNQLLENVGNVTDRISASFDLVWPRASTKTDNAIAGFLSNAHRHHSNELDLATGSVRGLMPLLADVYATLTRWAEVGESPGERPALDRSREELDRALALLGEPVLLALNQSSQLRRYKSSEKERASRHAELEARHGEAVAQVEGLRGQIASLEAARIAVLAEQQETKILLARFEEKLAAADTSRGEMRNSNERLKEKLEEARAGRSELASRHAELEARHGEAVAQVEGLRGQIASLEAARIAVLAEQQETKILLARFEEKLAAADTSRGEMRNSNERLKEKLEEARAGRSELASRHAELEARHGEAVAQVEGLRGQIASLEAARITVLAEQQETKILLARFEEKLAAADISRGEIRASNERLKEKLEEARSDKATLLTNHQATKDDLTQSEKRVSTFKRELELSQNRLRQVEKNLSEQIEVTSEHIVSLEKRASEFNQLQAKFERVTTEHNAYIEIIEKKLVEQARIASDRQSAIEHLRRDRAIKVAERDERNERLQAKIGSLQDQLSVVYLQEGRAKSALPLKQRIGRALHLASALSAERRMKQIEMLRASRLFDPLWYLAKYEDVRQQGLDPVEHYLDHGGMEGRWPSAEFDARYYLDENTDVREAGVNPLVHYLEHGQLEGRSIRTLSETKRRATYSANLQSAKISPREDSYVVPSNPVFVAESKVSSEPDANLEIDKAKWSSRSLSFSSLQHIANLREGTDTDVGATEAGVMVCNVTVARAKSDITDEPTVAACRWMEALGALGVQKNDLSGAQVGYDLESAIRFALCEDKLSIADAWFDTPGELRIRFVSASGLRPMILRSYQHGDDANLYLCGEVPLASGGDIIAKINILSLYRPVLLVLVDDEGALADSAYIPFPSLFRGGTHFGELAATADKAGILSAVRDKSVALLRNYIETTEADATSALSHTSIDISGANGTEPALDPKLIAWLVNDLGITVTVRGVEVDELGSIAIKADIEAMGEPNHARATAASLEIPASSIPTLDVLFAKAGELMDGAGGSVFMHPVENLAAYSTDFGCNGGLADFPAFPNFDHPATIGGGSSSGKPINLTLCWPRLPGVPVENYFPVSAYKLPSLVSALAEDRKLSVLVDHQNQDADLIPLLVSVARLETAFDLDCVIIASHQKNEQFGPHVSSILKQVRIVSSTQPDQMTRLGEASRHCKSDLFLLLDDSVILHDERVGVALWDACNTPGAGSASCALVTETAGAKGAAQLHKSGGWIGLSKGEDCACLAKPDLVGYTLPAVFPIAAPDLRCTMMDRALFQRASESAECELTLGLAIRAEGLAHRCLNYVTATSSMTSVEIGNTQTSIPDGVLHIRRHLA